MYVAAKQHCTHASIFTYMPIISHINYSYTVELKYIGTIIEGAALNSN